jgi:hypothetical protein
MIMDKLRSETQKKKDGKGNKRSEIDTKKELKNTCDQCKNNGWK